MKCSAIPRIAFYVLLVLYVLSPAPGLAAPPASGEPLRVGGAGTNGPLEANKLNNLPVGVANVFGGEMPDLFVIGGSRFYPEMVVFPWRETSPDGVPVFNPPKAVSLPDSITYGVQGTVFEQDGRVCALWIVENALVQLELDKSALAFHETARIPLPEFPRGPSTVGRMPDVHGNGFRLFYEVSDGSGYGPPMDGFTSSRDPRYDPYDGAGIWRGKMSYAGLYTTHHTALLDAPQAAPARASLSESEVLRSYEGLTAVELEPGRYGLIGGSRFGPLYYYALSSSADHVLDAYRYLAGNDGISLRHPAIRATPIAYPDAHGRLCDLLVGGEGAVYFYRFLGRFTETGQPVYDEPVPALQHDACLYGGTLPVPNVVDWDGDGALDIVSGNSEGFILFFKNGGDDVSPAFGIGVPLMAGGETIYVQAGYSGSIQGPDEARWGYVCPTVADWNGDGLLDLLMSDVTAEHHVYLNEGTATEPRLSAAHPIYLDGLELHGTWRVKPAVANLAGRMAYAVLDTDDEFHLYWQLDAYNVTDGGKLRLESGEVIGANFLKAGGTGRIKISFSDWDEDGRTDLLIGTPRHASIPDPEKGLPQALGLPGSGVLLLRNVGSDAAPQFAYPEVLHFRNEPIFFGQHACGPTTAAFGGGERPGLLVGIETGRFLFFERNDVRFAPVEVTEPVAR